MEKADLGGEEDPASQENAFIIDEIKDLDNELEQDSPEKGSPPKRRKHLDLADEGLKEEKSNKEEIFEEEREQSPKQI